MIIAALLLCTLGTVVLYSSSPNQAILQAIFCLIGLGLYWLISNFDYRAIKPFRWILYSVVIVLLLIVAITNFETRGSVRWIPLGLFNLQPSELAKPVLIVVLGFFWATRQPTVLNILKSLAILGPIFFLIFRQPDLGTALTVGFIWFGMLLAANVSFWKVAIMGVMAALMAPVSWLLMHDYQRNRITSFLFPTNDPLGKGFHVIQSTIAVGSGQLFGRGLGRGTQSRLQFLPEFRTDFIFAFIAEELGFIGSLIVLTLYGVLFWFCYRVLAGAEDRLGELLVAGVMSMLFFQTVVNIGMNIGIMPVTGITLPLLSYGGSSLIAIFISLGFIQSVKRFGSRRKSIETFSLTEI